jgi:hypothetical protein
MTAERLVIKPPKQEEHFEHIWEASEALYADTIANTPISSIIAELQAKLSVYKAVSEQQSLEGEDLAKTKEHVMGNILMAMSKLSLKDGVNTWAALKQAVEDKKLGQMEASFAKTANPGMKSQVESVFTDLKDKVSSGGMSDVLDTLSEFIQSKISEASEK